MNDIQELKNKTIKGLFWRFGERIIAQLISFIVSIILARLLMPEEYGIIAMVTIFINIANVFVTSGLGTSLVQKKDADEIDFSTMFWTSIAFSVILYIILFFTAPFIAKMYKNDLLTSVLRIMGLKLPIAAFSTIQQAYVQRKMIYKKFFFSTIIGTIISAAVGIIMAFNGFGVWALVAQYLTNSAIDTLVLFLTIDWHPKFKFSFNKFKPLFSYGWKIMLTSLIGTVFDQLRGLIIGIKYSSADLAYNNKGEQIPKLLSNNINSTVESVLFSSISKVQEDKMSVKKATRRIIQLSSFILMPLLFGIFGIADTLIDILLTNKWQPCVPYLRAVCIGECFSIINIANLQALKAVGRSDITLKLEFIKKPLYLIIVLISLPFGPLTVCIGNSLYSIVALFINSKPNKEILNYSLKEQIKDMYIYFIVSLLMCIFVILVGMCKINIILKLGMQIIIGILIYCVLCKTLNLESWSYAINILKSKFLRNN